MQRTTHDEYGGISGSLIAIIGLGLFGLICGSLAIWAYLSYNEQKTNVDGKIALAVAEAKKEQGDADEKKFSEAEKEPNRLFVGPEDYGRVSFSYPKTWSVYVADDAGKGGTYEAYLNPVTVPPVGASDQKFALRVTIENDSVDDVLDEYEGRVEDGALKSSATNSNGHKGTRLDGSLSDDIRGAVVVYKIRDKTLTIRTDADTFKADFNKLVKTIDFNA